MDFRSRSRRRHVHLDTSDGHTLVSSTCYAMLIRKKEVSRRDCDEGSRDDEGRTSRGREREERERRETRERCAIVPYRISQDE